MVEASFNRALGLLLLVVRGSCLPSKFSFSERHVFTLDRTEGINMRRIVGWMDTLKCPRREEWISNNSLSVDVGGMFCRFLACRAIRGCSSGFSVAADKRVLCA